MVRFKQVPQKDCFTYSVYEYKGLICLLYLFNGNIILNKVQRRFKAWLTFYNTQNMFFTYSAPFLNADLSQPEITLDTAWLTGFTQAEGGFYLGVEKRKGRNSTNVYSNYRFVKKYHVSQKNELNTLKQIRFLFFEQIPNKKKNKLPFSRMTLILTDKNRNVNQLQLSSKHYLLVVINYFNKSPLYGAKKANFISGNVLLNLIY